MTELLPLDAAGLAFIGGYLVILLGIGYWSYRARRTNSMRDFYLAGDGIGFVVLLLTLYATQYSGNTLFGFPGKTYRIGYSWLIAVHFMTAIVCVYVFFAPQLHRLSQRHSFVTPTDFWITLPLRAAQCTRHGHYGGGDIQFPACTAHGHGACHGRLDRY